MRTRVIALAVVAAVAVAGVETWAQVSAWQEDATGAWNVTIAPEGFPPCAAPSLMTADGGIMANACANNESPGYGQWVRTGKRGFAATFVGLEYAPDGTANGTYKVRATAVVSRDGQRFRGPFVTDIFAPDGTLVFTVTGEVRGTRVVVEPM
jgi:hypothetical protein